MARLAEAAQVTLFRRLPDGYSEVLPAWRGETAVILGAGPSLTREQCEYVSGRARVVAINNAYRMASWADALYFGDLRWLKDFKAGEREDFNAFAGVRVTIEEGKKPVDPRYHMLRNIGVEGLSSDPRGIFNGRTSPYAVINWLALAGVARIVLLGCDYRHVNGKDHFEGGGHPITTGDLEWAAFAKTFSTLEQPLKAHGIEVVNATPGSRIDAFPRVPLDLVTWFRESVAA